MEEAFMQRTVTCGELRAKDEGKSVILNGWVARNRDHGALHFINLRDRYGVTQVVVDDDASEELEKTASSLKMEYCIAVKGIVRKRRRGAGSFVAFQTRGKQGGAPGHQKQ